MRQKMENKKKLLERIEKKMLLIGSDKYKSYAVSIPRHWVPPHHGILVLSYYDDHTISAEFKEDKDSILFKPQ